MAITHPDHTPFHHPPPLIALPPASSSTRSQQVYAQPSRYTTLEYLSHTGFTYEKQLIDLTGHSNHNIPGVNNDNMNNKTSSDELDRINASDSQFLYKNMIVNTDMDDYYRLLGLSQYETTATLNEIKKAYKIVSLVIHPDKAIESDRDHASELFKATQKAYEQLTDLTLRRRYDSSLEFDDEIPDEKTIIGRMKKSDDPNQEFIDIFAPVFQRNSLFSLYQPILQLGDMSSDYSYVNEFYDQWFTYKSWRDYAYLNEHQVEQASGRDEKRWMERENNKLQAEQKKLESVRIRTLVDRAYKYDPRIKQQIADKEQERKNKKLAKKNQLEQKRIDSEQAQKQAEAAAAEKRKQLEAEREAEKVGVKQAEFMKLQLIQLLKSLNIYNESTTNLFVLYLQSTTIDQLYRLLSDPTTVDQGKSLYNDELKKYTEYHAQRSDADKAADAERNTLLQAKLANEKKLFTSDENHSLSKSIAKYPAGIKQRWEKITSYHNNQCNVNRSVNEIIKQCKLLEKNMKSMDAQDMDKYKSKLGVPQDNTGNPTELNVRILEQKLDKSSISTDNTNAWSNTEQQLLEQGLQEYKKDDRSRWDKIAALVSTKNKKQCMDRYKWVRDNIVKQK